MVLDRACVHAEIREDDLAGVASKDQLHDLAMSWSETHGAIRCILLARKQLTQNLKLFNRLVFLTKHRLRFGKSLSQKDFRAHTVSQLVFVPRKRALQICRCHVRSLWFLGQP